jgi:hypothetical protein
MGDRGVGRKAQIRRRIEVREDGWVSRIEVREDGWVSHIAASSMLVL